LRPTNTARELNAPHYVTYVSVLTSSLSCSRVTPMGADPRRLNFLLERASPLPLTHPVNFCPTVVTIPRHNMHQPLPLSGFVIRRVWGRGISTATVGRFDENGSVRINDAPTRRRLMRGRKKRGKRDRGLAFEDFGMFCLGANGPNWYISRQLQ